MLEGGWVKGVSDVPGFGVVLGWWGCGVGCHIETRMNFSLTRTIM